MADKPVCGEAARVKKSPKTDIISHSSQIKNDSADTFTSSKDKSNAQNIKNSEECKKTARKAN